MLYRYNDQITKHHRRNLRKNQTDAECVVWNLVRRQQINGLKFFRQYSVGSYILDFYCPEKRVAIEIDGGQHNETDGQEHDRQRTAYLEDQHIKVIRFWNNEVLENREGVWARIQESITPPHLPLNLRGRAAWLA